MESENSTAIERKPRLAIISRLTIAWFITIAVLPYTWARTMLLWMSDADQPELIYAAIVIGSLLATSALTYRLGGKFQPCRRQFWILGAVIVSWIAANIGLILFRSGELVPRSQVIVGYLPATLWVVWAGWMGFPSIRWRTRIAVLAFSAMGVVLFLVQFRVAGLTGSANIDFVYRAEEPPTTVDLPHIIEDAGDYVNIELTERAGDFSQYLGPDRNGVLRDVTLSRDWKTRPPKLLWRKPVGPGWSGFAIVGDYAITQEQRGEYECVICYRVVTGKVVWIHRNEANFHLSMGGSGPRATPTVNDGRVYTVGATGILNCLEGSNGSPVWSVNILEDTGANNISHGVCVSPLVTDFWVIVCPTGGDGPSLVAYDRDTGGRVWSGGKWRASYSSPVLTEIASVPQILNFTSKGLASHSFTDGKVLWDFPWKNNVATNVAQPITLVGSEDRVLIGSGYSLGSALLNIAQQDDNWTATEIWTSKQMKTKFTTAVIHEGYLYGLDDGIFTCVSLETGERIWKRGRYGHGQILLADNLIVVLSEKGDVVLVEPNPKKLIELGKISALSSKTWNIPAITPEILLIRNDREAACYQLQPIKE